MSRPWPPSLLPPRLGSAQAQTTPIKFPSRLALRGTVRPVPHPMARAVWDAKLDVTIDAGTARAAPSPAASGAYDMGFMDLAAPMEFHANNPDAPEQTRGHHDGHTTTRRLR